MSNTSADALSASTASFITSLTVNMAIAGAELVGFILARRWIKAVYEPRTYIPPRKDQAPPLGTNLLMPIWRVIQADPEDIIRKNGIDPYVFYRFLQMMAKAMIPIWLLSWLILLPVDSVGSNVLGKEGLDRFTFGNVATDKQHRYWAHLVLDWVFIAWILLLIWRECGHWLIIRQKHLINPKHSSLPQANTVLITGIPERLMDEEKLAQLYHHLPGGVKRIWLARDLKEMPDLHERRLKAVKMLESAQVNLIKTARQHKIDTEKKIAKLQKKNKPVPASLTGPVNPQLLEGNVASSTDEPQYVDPKYLPLVDQLVPRSKRPTTRLKPRWAPFTLGWLGIGQKVDTIDWARKEIMECSETLEKSRKQLEKDVNTVGIGEEVYPPLRSAFIHFNQQIAAHMAAQCLAHNEPYAMSSRYIEQSSDNVIWRNMALTAYEANLRRAGSYAATVGLIILWTFPVAFIGALSNVATLVKTYSWLSWIGGDSTAKHILQGVISGILPPVLLAVIMLILPAILRQLAAFEGIPSKTNVELDLMTRYFIFLVIHTFFVVTLSSGLISSIRPIAENPSSVATILAQQMPTASTFFITLILTQFTGSAGTLLQAISLVLYYLRVILGGGSPRSVFSSKYRLQHTSWGTAFPGVTVYAVIMIAYCIISPIINGFGALFFLLSAFIYKYLYIWVYDQPPQTDTGGLFFPKAITHVFVGMYIQEVCMCALFFLARNTAGKASAIPQGALMVVLIVCTAAVHYVIATAYKPLVHNLPMSLAHLSYGMPKEEGHEDSQIGSRPADEQERTGSRERLTNGEGVEEPIHPEKPANQNAEVPASVEKSGNPVDLTNHNNTEKRFTAPEPHHTPAHETPTSPPQPEHQGLSLAGILTSAGPPLGFTHPASAEQLEMGTFAQQPDPALEINPEDDKDEEQYFAVPGGPGVLTQRDQMQDDNDPNAFFHPATKEPQKILWLPRDELGLAEAEIEGNAKWGVESTCRYAILDHNGKVKISGPPPDFL